MRPPLAAGAAQTAQHRSILDLAWELAPQVALRPEPFGALLYHFGSRQLSFLKDPRLRDVVNRLGASSSARDAITACGITSPEVDAFAAGLQRLADTQMIRERRTCP
ncbi:MAG: mycofactocin biosynthesis chaperone MftB [Mycobacteriales bacterium]